MRLFPELPRVLSHAAVSIFLFSGMDTPHVEFSVSYPATGI